MKMTLEELRLLPQKDIKAYVLMKKPNAKAPKKWENKTKCMAWAEKTLNGEAKVEKPKKEVKPKAKAENKVKKEKAEASDQVVRPISGAGQLRRKAIVKMLQNEFCTALELADKTKVKYKSILDDIHAIKHGRGKLASLVPEGFVLIAVRRGQSKVYRICEAKKQEAVEKEIEETIEIA